MGIENQAAEAACLFGAVAIAAVALIWAACVVAQEWEMAKWHGNDGEGGE